MASLAAHPLGTFRPAQAQHTYAHPAAEVARLHDRGLLHRLADGYYVVVPQAMVGRGWMPGLETAAAGIASAIYGPGEIVVMGVSAARLHGAIPRALATATVAVPAQHRPIALSDRTAVVRFVKRNTQVVDAERWDTELGSTLLTTPEQTILDLAHRPELGNAEIDVPNAVAALYERSDKDRLQALATEQRRIASLKRARVGWPVVVKIGVTPGEPSKCRCGGVAG
ncbi:type IV toxin-antitoxin system AbiEi family antitoxin [Mycobacterium sp.]|uniref:type IV toxin-antitoxin system AbiEi family antitoxin domain-containing protein n=1 Tax=Mycobacterium sp. TaxID=1785 RepID=UPI0031DE9F5A